MLKINSMRNSKKLLSIFRVVSTTGGNCHHGNASKLIMNHHYRNLKFECYHQAANKQLYQTSSYYRSNNSSSNNRQQNSRSEFRKKLFLYAVMAVIPLPIVIMLISRYLLNLFSRDEQLVWNNLLKSIENIEEENNEQVYQLNADINLELIIRYCVNLVKSECKQYNFLENEISTIAVDQRETKSLITKREGEFKTYNMKGILFFYIPIMTDKGACLIKATYLANNINSNMNNNNLFPYKIQLCQINLQNTKHGFKTVIDEEDDPTILSLNSSQLQYLFGNLTDELKCIKIPNQVIDVTSNTNPFTGSYNFYEFSKATTESNLPELKIIHLKST